jgi:quinol monooxygenase YgiN
MSITRLTVFPAQEGKSDELRRFLSGVVATIRASPGCQSCQLLVGHDRPTRQVVLEVWDSIDAHKASVKQIPPAALAEVMKLLAEPPSGEYLEPL